MRPRRYGHGEILDPDPMDSIALAEYEVFVRSTGFHCDADRVELDRAVPFPTSELLEPPKYPPETEETRGIGDPLTEATLRQQLTAAKAHARTMERRLQTAERRLRDTDARTVELERQILGRRTLTDREAALQAELRAALDRLQGQERSRQHQIAHLRRLLAAGWRLVRAATVPAVPGLPAVEAWLEEAFTALDGVPGAPVPVVPPAPPVTGLVSVHCPQGCVGLWYEQLADGRLRVNGGAVDGATGLPCCPRCGAPMQLGLA